MTSRRSASAPLLEAGIFTPQGPGNQLVVKMLLDSGLNLEAQGKDGKTVIQVVHEACTQNTCSTPSKEMVAFLDQADKAKSVK